MKFYMAVCSQPFFISSGHQTYVSIIYTSIVFHIHQDYMILMRIEEVMNFLKFRSAEKYKSNN